MANGTQIAQTLLPLAGAGAGALMGGPAGAALGGTIGQTLGAGIGLLGEQPEAMGASAGQQAVAGIQMRNLEKLQEQQGLNAQQVQNLAQAQFLSNQQQIQQMNALAMQNLTPVDRQNMIRGVLNLIEEQRSGLQETVGALDLRAEAQRLATVGSQSAIAAQQQQAIRDAEMQAQIREEAIQNQNRQNFAKLLGNVAVSAAQVAGTMGEQAPQDPSSIGAETQELGAAKTRFQQAQQERAELIASADERKNIMIDKTGVSATSVENATGPADTMFRSTAGNRSFGVIVDEQGNVVDNVSLFAGI